MKCKTYLSILRLKESLLEVLISSPACLSILIIGREEGSIVKVLCSLARIVLQRLVWIGLHL